MNTTQSTNNETKSNGWFSGLWGSSKSQPVVKETIDEKVQKASLLLKETEDAKSKSLQERKEFFALQTKNTQLLNNKVRAEAPDVIMPSTDIPKEFFTTVAPTSNPKAIAALHSEDMKRRLKNDVICTYNGIVQEKKQPKRERLYASYAREKALRIRPRDEVLDLAWRQDLAKKHSFEKILKDFWHVKEIDLTLSNIQDESLQQGLLLSGNLLHLESIRLDYTYLNKESLKKILKAFPKLKALHVSFLPYVSSEETLDLVLPWVQKNPELEDLNIAFGNASMDDISKLIDALPLTIKSFQTVLRDKTVQEVQSFFLRLYKDGKNCLQSLKVDLFNSGFLDYDMCVLSREFPKLQRIKLGGISGLTSGVVRDIYLNWKELNHLALDNSMLDPDDLLKVVQSTKKLYSFELALYDSKEVPQDLLLKVAQSLAENSGSTLKHLSIYGYTLQQGCELDPAIRTLQPILPNLKSLELNGLSHTSDQLMDFISANITDKLQYFTFSWPSNEKQQVSSNVLGEFYVQLGRKAPTMQYLILSGNIYEGFPDIGNNALENIARSFNNLRYLDFRGLEPIRTCQVIQSGILKFILHNSGLTYVQPVLNFPPDYLNGGSFFDADSVLSIQRVQPKIGKSVFIETDPLFVFSRC